MRILPALLASLALLGCALPRWPVEAPLTSPYGVRFRGLSPDMHKGVDLAAPLGTPVLAMKRGTVEFAGEMRGYGLVVMLRHGRNVRTVYAHLSQISVKKGDAVEGRQTLGLSGQSGDATGPHLHFEVQRWGHEEDPVQLLGGIPGR
ncbi:MAG TPA: M23 family metallopeptidase [Longimicrobiales bacterium]|nr:M23 family metallopeptidase [Longimicrobiales bacterium]